MADFSHDDLMFAARVAGMKRGPRGGGELAAALTTPGDDGTNDLVRTLVGGMMRERELKMENQLRRQAAEEDFNRRAALEREQGDRADTRLFAELGARKSEREGTQAFQSSEAERADTRRAKASKDDFERANAAQVSARKSDQEFTRARDMYQGSGEWPADQGGSDGGEGTPKPGSPAAIRRAALRVRAMEPLQEALLQVQQGVRTDFSENAGAENRARRPGHLVKLQQMVEQLGAIDPQSVAPALQPVVDELLAAYERGGRNDGEALDMINKIKRLQGYEPWNPDKNPDDPDEAAWKKAHPPLRSGMMPGFVP